MTREEALSESFNKLTYSKNIILELTTGFGKSCLSIGIANHWIDTEHIQNARVLLVVAGELHKTTWKKEIDKWGGLHADSIITECYNSLFKYESQEFDIVIADECHHLSTNRILALHAIKFKHLVGLSATIPEDKWKQINMVFHPEKVVCEINEAIESKVLPVPEILLLPITLDNAVLRNTIELNPTVKGDFTVGSYKYLKFYLKNRRKVRIPCTDAEYYQYMAQRIEWCKNTYKATQTTYAKNKWLRLCGDRLEFLANLKMPIVSQILKLLDNKRTVTFCKTIEQCKALGEYSIHSKNKESNAIYNKFNKLKIDHITAVDVLNENANLVDCKYAIFLNLTSSKVVTYQRLGRMMRHKEPVIIIPYVKNTRDQELIEVITLNMNPEFIKTINSIKEIPQ